MRDEILFSVQAEATWIATAIYNPAFLRIENNMRPSFMYMAENKCLAWALQTLVVEKNVESIDALNLEMIISSNEKVLQIMNDNGLSDLHEYIELAKYTVRETYEEFKLVEDEIITYAFRRELRTFSQRLYKNCENLNITLDDLSDFCNNGIQSVVDKYVFGADSCEIGQEIDEAWNAICSKRTDTGYGIPFFLPRMNEFVSLVGGELTILLGATGKGKSSFFMVQALYTALKLKIPTLIIDSELTTEIWLSRALASISGVAVWKIKTGKMNDEEFQEVEKAKAALKASHIVHYFQPQFDKLKTEQLCRKWVNNGYGLIIYDYIKPTAPKYGSAEISQSLGLETDFLKGIAGKMNIPILCGLQQNKQTGEAADSQKPERYCDTMIYWEEKSADRIAEDGVNSGNFMIRIGKNRNGASTTDETYIDVKFQMNVMRIGEGEMHRRHSETPFD